MNVSYSGPNDLPELIPIFPLPGALLLPRGQMPLNIFEPRYMEMIDDAIRSSRLIGLVQPEMSDRLGGKQAGLFNVGCVGRITQFAETGDNRYVISLTGVARFKIHEERTVTTSYRQCLVSFDPFLSDFIARAGEEEVDRPAVLTSLKNFVEANQLQIDWKGISAASNEALVNALCMMAPFGPREKQALLEAPDLKTRAELLVAITEIELARRDDGSESSIQ
jgi:Lon protease-like protein